MASDEQIEDPFAPRRNPDLLGHQAAEKRFLTSWRSGRVPHGWLITGPRGIGKATLAFRIARFVLANRQMSADEGPGLFGDQPTPAPDTLYIEPENPVFRRVASGGHSDLITLEREFNPETNETVWEYRDDPCTFFYSHHISGAERLASGNTLICEGSFGRLFEVTPEKEIVWEYINPSFGQTFFGDSVNWIFRAFRYTPESPEIAGRVAL